MRWAKPLDEELLLQIAADHELIVTLEEGCVMGGAGSAVMEALPPMA
jgi:1-deoxy-D-xylulose-5-phosphate synthase